MSYSAISMIGQICALTSGRVSPSGKKDKRRNLHVQVILVLEL
jgi:hypothetical protein